MKYKPQKGSRTHQVLKLLADGKVHETNELPVDKWATRRHWPTALCEDRYNWFWRAAKKGLVRRMSYGKVPAKWKITKQGKQALKELET